MAVLFGALWTLVGESTSLLVVVLVTLVCVSYAQKWWRQRHFPPGPWGLPVVGYGPFLDKKETFVSFKQLSEKYGPVYSLKLGKRDVVILSSYEAIKEAYVTQGDNFTAIPQDFYVLSWAIKRIGVVGTEGNEWKELRRFMLSSMRDFGFGKLKLEQNIHAEAETLMYMLKETDGATAFDFAHYLPAMTSNVISYLAFGKRFDYDDKRQNKIVEAMDELVKNMGNSALIEVFPFLGYFPESISGLDKVRRTRDEIIEFIEEQVKEHEETFDPNNMRDVVDVFLKALDDQQKEDRQQDPSKQQTSLTLTREYVVMTAFVMFMAGTDSTAASLAWILKQVAMNPEVQKRVQRDLDSVVGKNRLPSWTDRTKLPFIEATILEGQRIASIGATSLLHCNYEETTLFGYTIPRRTATIANFWQVQHDPKWFPDPEKFDPTRFIGQDGQLNTMRNISMPFSIGKRMCLGESLARMELFVFFCCIMQSYSLQAPPGETLTLETDTTGASAERKLASCRLVAVPRD